MILFDVRIPGRDGNFHVCIENGVIAAIAPDRESLPDRGGEQHVETNGMLLLPGLINSHDHLDFNCFPQLGHRIYDNYTQWGKEIHEMDREVIQEVKAIPIELRVQWGLYKNLLNGFTSVVNHGDRLRIPDPVINVWQECYSLHSPAFEKNWQWKINKPFSKNKPFVMHLGEGTDQAAMAEISLVISQNYWRRKVIGVHGVAMRTSQAGHFEALVWCPASNFFLLNSTADIHSLRLHVPVIFGSDSTLTSSWDIFNHLKQAASLGVENSDLMEMLTTTPARIWGWPNRGKIEVGAVADLVLFKTNKAIAEQDIDQVMMVVCEGEIRLIDASFGMERQVIKGTTSSVNIGTSEKIVAGNLPALLAAINNFFPFHPAGITQKSNQLHEAFDS